MYSRFVNWLSSTPFGSWVVKHIASKVDPVIFKATKGRFTSTGKPTLPMLTLMTVGRKSGEPRSVQLAYHPDGNDQLIVASAMGQERHPAWSYNIEANPLVEVQARGERYAAHVTRLSADEKAEVWPAIAQTIPQMKVYEKRTDRDIKVYRLRRA